MRLFPRVSRYALILLIVPLFCASALWPSTSRERDRYFELLQSVDIFVSLFKSLNHHYVHQIEPLHLIETTLREMLKQLDPYTIYISEHQVSSHHMSQSDELASTGLQVEQRTEGYFVRDLGVGPATSQSDEIRIGDILESINQQPIGARSLDEVHQLLSAPVGTSISLHLRHPGTTAPYKVELLLTNSKQSCVPHYQLLDNTSIGYLRFSRFAPTASSDFRSALQSLQEAGANALIIDLRDNGGGLLREALRISNFFIEKGAEIVRSQGKIETWNKIYYAEEEPMDMSIPIVALVNERSASASEILSGVLQDYDRGVVIGTQTYGKGLIQSTMSLPYQAQFRVTTAYYYTPSGRCIQSIDYGSATYTSLPPKTFYTQNQRPVHDRGGITPDILLDERTHSPLLRLLIDSLLIFDYATKYQGMHSSIRDTLSFALSEEEYQSFYNWLLKERRLYRTPVFQAFEQMSNELALQPTSSSLKEALKGLSARLREQIEEELSRHKQEIHAHLSYVIALRYYRARAPSRRFLQRDPYIQKAKEVLSDPSYYTRILSPKQ